MDSRVELDAALVGRIVESQFPQLGPASVVLLGQGYDSAAFSVNDAWVFRFPKRPDVERQLRIEMRILPALSQSCPVAIPAFCFQGRPSLEFPRRFGGYPRLPGVPAIQVEDASVPSCVAPTLARFLSWLHSIPVAGAAGSGVPEQPIEPFIQEVRAEALDGFAAVREVAPAEPLEAWYAYLEAGCRDVAPRSAPTLVHNDLAAEHVLLDPETRMVTGIIDWSDIAISDPAVDFAGVFHWGGDALVDLVLSTYDGLFDDRARSRARFMAACRGVGDVVFGLATGRREYVGAGIRALGLCARGQRTSIT